MSGNGVYEAHNCTNALPTGLNCIPPGVGGGCVKTGPFKKCVPQCQVIILGMLTFCLLSMSVNLGPVAPTLAESDVVATGPGSAYNPRCLKRDISAWVSSQWNTDANSTTLLTQNPDIYWFQTVMQGDFASGFYGVHTGGHFTFGGDPGGDIFSSPGDPAYVESSPQK
jgi:tyrosinase